MWHLGSLTFCLTDADVVVLALEYLRCGGLEVEGLESSVESSEVLEAISGGSEIDPNYI